LRWTADNRQIVPFTDREPHATAISNAALLDKYPAPSQSVDDILDVSTIRTELNRHNYVSQMKRLLELEELTQARIIAGSVTVGEVYRRIVLFSSFNSSKKLVIHNDLYIAICSL